MQSSVCAVFFLQRGHITIPTLCRRMQYCLRTSRKIHFKNMSESKCVTYIEWEFGIKSVKSDKAISGEPTGV